MLIIRKHKRARRMVLRYDTKNNCVKLTLPGYVSSAKGIEFAASKEGWLAKQIQENPADTLADGKIISLLGESVTIRHQGGRGTTYISGNELIIPGDAQFIARRIREFISKEMLPLCRKLGKIHAEKIGVRISALTLRDNRSRWGSCSIGGKISICWRLAFAPIAALDYVICHEVAHLKHHNHSKDFWKTVELLCPEYKKWEIWLRKNSAILHIN